MFSAVWPLAALVCLGHTIFRLRSNVLRLTRLSMRPVPEATSGIGLWHNLLLFEARACVLVNCLIVSVSTDQLDYFSCWSHSLWREEGAACFARGMTARMMIHAPSVAICWTTYESMKRVLVQTRVFE